MMIRYETPVDAMANSVIESTPAEGQPVWLWHLHTRREEAEKIRQEDPKQYAEIMATSASEDFNLDMGVCIHACWYERGSFISLDPEGEQKLPQPTHWQYRPGTSLEQARKTVASSPPLLAMIQIFKELGSSVVIMTGRDRTH